VQLPATEPGDAGAEVVAEAVGVGRVGVSGAAVSVGIGPAVADGSPVVGESLGVSTEAVDGADGAADPWSGPHAASVGESRTAASSGAQRRSRRAERVVVSVVADGSGWCWAVMRVPLVIETARPSPGRGSEYAAWTAGWRAGHVVS
jgi:hypothetical protein